MGWLAFGYGLPMVICCRIPVRARFIAVTTRERQLMVPGRTNQVACDISGRVVDFQIQEGKGDMRAYLLELGNKWSKEVDEMPVMVFDREGYGAEFFFDMSYARIDFVTWDKHVDTKKLDTLDADQFKEEFEVNEKQYRVFEDEKVFTHSLENKAESTFSLRRVNIWNVTGNRLNQRFGECIC